MKRIALFFALLSAVVSCGIPNEREVTVSNVDITGLINDYAKVVDGSYKFTNDGNDGYITVQFEKTAYVVGVPVCLNTSKHVRLNPICSNGIIQLGYHGFFASDTELAKLEELINRGNVGDKKHISFVWDYLSINDEQAKAIFNDASSFEIVDEAFQYEGIEDYSMSNSTSKKSVKSNSSNSKWDDVLDEYEKYVDNYIRLYKSAMAGNISALSEYADMMEQAETYADKLENAQGNMTQAQISRYLRITEKMSNALIDL